MSADGWDAIVIGSGIGGLACAAALANTGQRVLVLEQYVPGGLTQTFSGAGYTWNVGVHYLGEMGPGGQRRRDSRLARRRRHPHGAHEAGVRHHPLPRWLRNRVLPPRGGPRAGSEGQVPGQRGRDRRLVRRHGRGRAGLFLAGQDVTMPGMTGAMMGGVLAAASAEPRVFGRFA